MYRGRRSRKQTLVEFGFRLPSALDNRPLKFRGNGRGSRARLVYVSATRATTSSRIVGLVVEQLIRPTGLIDPEIRCAGRHPGRRPARRNPQAGRAGARVLVTCLTKKMAEDLTD